mmetsp:Transcript_13060/g.15677  ORF Transcript_13060/g.15677 Transcript_13060/m.15677 type:complete len:80 (+) Transcript_13060:299-538(+)
MDGEQDKPEILAFSEPVSKRNEEEVLALLSVSVDDAVDEAKFGAQNAADDDVIASYLTARSQTLATGLKLVEKKLEALF